MKAYGKNFLCKEKENDDVVSSSAIKEFDIISIGHNIDDLDIIQIFSDKYKQYKDYFIVHEDDVLAFI